MKKEKLLTILGPTAVGKTELSVYLAKILGSSIISGDAFQVYRGMGYRYSKGNERRGGWNFPLSGRLYGT